VANLVAASVELANFMLALLLMRAVMDDIYRLAAGYVMEMMVNNK